MAGDPQEVDLAAHATARDSAAGASGSEGSARVGTTLDTPFTSQEGRGKASPPPIDDPCANCACCDCVCKTKHEPETVVVPFPDWMKWMLGHEDETVVLDGGSVSVTAAASHSPRADLGPGIEGRPAASSSPTEATSLVSAVEAASEPVAPAEHAHEPAASEPSEQEAVELTAPDALAAEPQRDSEHRAPDRLARRGREIR